MKTRNYLNRRLLIIIVALSFSMYVFSQESIKWGKPTKSEISLKECSFDTLANAVILSEQASIKMIAGYANIQVYRKIKILNSNGLKHANVQIPFYHKENLDKINDLKAQTLNIVDGEIAKKVLGKEEFYTKIHNTHWSDISFIFPSVKEGSIIEYSYTLVSRRIAFLKAWDFQHEIPTIYSQLQVRLPSHLKYRVLLYGDSLNQKYNGKENKGLWILNNLKGYEFEKNVFCYDDYVEKIEFQLLKYEAFEGGGYSNGFYEVNVLKDWPQLAKDVFEEHKMYMNRSGKAKELLNALVNTTDSNSLKINKIYNYLKTGFQWDKIYFIYPVQSLTDLLNSGKGNSAELNLLYCLLLNEAGINAFPVLISTKYHGKTTRSCPLLDQFNHLMVAIEDGEGYIFSDALSEEYVDYSLIPFHHYNYYGFLIDGKSGKWIDMENKTDSKEIIFTTCLIDSLGINLQVDNKFCGYFALNQRNYLKNHEFHEPENISFAGNMPFVKDSASNAVLYPDYSQSFYYSSKFNFGDIIQLNLNSNDAGNLYKQNERLFPIEFDYTFSKQRLYKITVPDGYVPKVFPENMNIALPNNAGKFIYSIAFLGNQLTVVIKQDITVPILPKEYYEYLKEFYNLMIMKINEPIIFEKAS